MGNWAKLCYVELLQTKFKMEYAEKPALLKWLYNNQRLLRTVLKDGGTFEDLIDTADEKVQAEGNDNARIILGTFFSI